LAVTNIRVIAPVPAEPLDAGQCNGVGKVLARVGEKWSVIVISCLGDRPRRFNELHRMIEGVSQRMLTLTLKNLERDGLVTRTVTPMVPPRVDYALTPLGRSMLEPVQALGQWALAHLEEMDAARRQYDTREDQGAR
jgi:DNA-binding HxlR family transcriptional regulator